MRLTEQEILYEFGKLDYEKGRRYARTGKVVELEVKARRQRIHLSGVVEGATCYNVEVVLGESSLSYCCDCPQCYITGQCKHITAVLFEYLYSMDRSDGAAANKRSSDLMAKQLLRQAEQQSVQSLPSARENGDALRLIPQIGFLEQEKQLILGLAVGNTRPYVVKDLGDFLDAMEHGKEVTYGKGLTFVHRPEALDEEGRWLLELMRQNLAYFSTVGVNPYYGVGTNNTGRRMAALSPYHLDQFFAHYLGGTVEQVPGHERFRLCSEQPELEASLHSCNGGVELQLLEEGKLLQGASHPYLAAKGAIFPCSEELAQLARAALSNRADRYTFEVKPLFFEEKDLPMLASVLLPKVKRWFTVTGDEGALESFLPDTPLLQYYLDWDGEGISAQMKAVYQGTVLSLPSQQEAAGVRRNRLAERRGQAALERWFGPAVQGKYRLEAEETLFDFTHGGIAELQGYGEVYSTERLRQLNPPQPKVHVGVSVSGGLLDLDIQTGDFPLSELEALADAVRNHRHYYRMKNGSFLSLEGDSALCRVAELQQGLGLNGKALEGGQVSVPLYRAPYLDQTLKNGEDLRYSRDDGFRKLVRSFRTVTDSDYTLPQQYRELLRPYQKTGFRWLKTLAQYGFGGILADDMGLGKTVQMLSFLSSAKEEGNTLPSLVVCPASLVLNWGDECKKFAPELRVLLLSGSAAERKSQWEEMGDCDLAVISYDSLRRDVDALTKLQFYSCILDEAQYIKNHTTLSFRTVKKVNSRLRFAMTGTPVENRLSELWSIFDFLMPGYLYRYSEFQSRLEKPVAKEQDPVAAARLGQLTEPFVLRRLKTDVLKELPPKTESVYYVALGEEQRKLYTAVAADGLEELKRSGGDAEKMQVLVLLMRLRQICCDPSLVMDDFTGESAKLESCMELIREAVEGGHRILIFSQFTSMLELLRRRLEAEQISSFVLQGSTPKMERSRLVERFNAGEAEVFLISLKAGGTGLNLTRADVVIHYDPWWNEAAQNQATDRAYRIGQKNPVQVYKLIGKNTIEEKILELQLRKRELAQTVAGTEEGILALSSEELMGLLETSL